MIIIKTKIQTMPLSCKECSYHLVTFFGDDVLIGCPILKNWITKEERKNGKQKLEDCPLTEE